MSPRSKEANKQIIYKRKEQILDAAAKVFSKNGFAGARTAEIALEAGISEGLIFRHFKTKEKIFIELIKMATTQIDLLKYISELNISPLDKIRTYFYYTVLLLSRYNTTLIFNIIQQAKVSDAIPNAAKKILKASSDFSRLELLIPIIKEGQKFEQIKQHDPEKLSVAFYSMLEGWAALELNNKNLTENKIPLLDVGLAMDLLENPKFKDSASILNFKSQLKTKQLVHKSYTYRNINNKSGNISKTNTFVTESETVEDRIRIFVIEIQNEKGLNSTIKIRADDFHPLYKETRDSEQKILFKTIYTGDTIFWDYPGNKSQKKIIFNGEFYDGDSLNYILPAFLFEITEPVSLVLVYGAGSPIPADYAPLDIQNTGTEKIKVPAGDFECYNLEISLGLLKKAKDSFTANNYYSVKEPHILVKTRYVDDIRDYVTELVEYE